MPDADPPEGLDPHPPQDPEAAAGEALTEVGAPAPQAAEPSATPAESAPPPAAPPTSAGPKSKRRWLRGLLMVLLLIFIVGPVLTTLAYRFIPPPVTMLMLLRAAQGHGLDYRWRGLEDMSPTLVQAAIASEDSGFCQHHGFDFAAMQKAMAHNERRPGKVRGGSTISQQTAKNVFLWPDRTYVRKGLEAWFTVLTEAIWGKRRIMEMYLNVVEMGPGVYGAEAASQRDFHHSARTLTQSEAAHLVAILPSPLKWQAVDSGPYVARRAGRIGARVGVVREDGLAACVLR
jgi:monofunctional biosynthetic peptidoglycan transglycosylase